METIETLLLEVDIDDEEKHLTLMDGSAWFVNPGDLPIVATWLPTANIRVEDSKDESTFSFILTNLNDKVSVRALKIG